MNQDEWADPTTCIDCGAPIWPEADRAFASAPGVYLCFACSERRGGVYDERHERWATPPDMTGLYDEQRPHP